MRSNQLYNYLLLLLSVISLIIWGCHTRHEAVNAPATHMPQKRVSDQYDKLHKKAPEGVKSVKADNSKTEHIAEYRNTSVMEKYAVKLGVSKADLKNPSLYALIDEWYSTPYKWGGRSKAGIDCSDFTEVVLEKIYGITITGPASNIYKQCEIIPKTDLQEGDLVFFNISGPLSHVGVYLCNNKFVHASVRAGVVIEDLNLEYYKRYFYKAARIKRS